MENGWMDWIEWMWKVDGKWMWIEWMWMWKVARFRISHMYQLMTSTLNSQQATDVVSLL